jgi:hypothetical protein
VIQSGKKRRRPRKDGKPSRLRGNFGPRAKNSEPTFSTSANTKVPSQYEKKCAEYLKKRNIKFVYEPLILLEGRQYHPDFFLPEYDLFLEICGYNHMPFYNDRTAFKRRLYQKHNLRALFIHYNGKGSLDELIQKELNRHLRDHSE